MCDVPEMQFALKWSLSVAVPCAEDLQLSDCFLHTDLSQVNRHWPNVEPALLLLCFVLLSGCVVHLIRLAVVARFLEKKIKLNVINLTIF